jgi:hypothetical protein
LGNLKAKEGAGEVIPRDVGDSSNQGTVIREGPTAARPMQAAPTTSEFELNIGNTAQYEESQILKQKEII